MGTSYTNATNKYTFFEEKFEIFVVRHNIKEPKNILLPVTALLGFGDLGVVANG
jgi:hypothetical protein